jgi:hypothetical protein
MALECVANPKKLGVILSGAMGVQSRRIRGIHTARDPPVLAFIVAPHNTWMHWEHHEWPAIPFWNLPQARELETTTPVISIWELFRFYGRCPAIKTGQPTLDKFGKSLIGCT